MKRILTLSLVCIMLTCKIQAQETNRAITTAVPFLLIAADARAAGLADQGVATSPDAFSQQCWRIIFGKCQVTIGASKGLNNVIT